MQATQIFSRSGVCSLGLFHTTAQVAAAWHPLAEQIAELPWSLIGPAWQVGLTCRQKDPVDGLVMARSTRVFELVPRQATFGRQSGLRILELTAKFRLGVARLLVQRT